VNQRSKSLFCDALLRSVRSSVIVGITLLASGCITSAKKNELQTSSGKSAVVVTQPGLSSPIVSSFDKNRWIQIRDTSTSEVSKLYAMLATGDSDSAVSHARDFLAKNPGNLDGLNVLAAGLVLERNWQLAGYYAGMIEKQSPGSPEALNIRGIAAMLTANNTHADYLRAIDLLQKAHDSSETQIAAGLNLGHLQLEMGNAQGALAVFKTVVDRCDDCSSALVGQGVAASRTKNWDIARESFERVIKQNQRHFEARFHLAMVMRNGFNDKKGAEDILAKLLNDPANDNRWVKERASSALRKMRGELDESERTGTTEPPLEP
jgi:tetratricopeptide (TPR) repeat protein